MTNSKAQAIKKAINHNAKMDARKTAQDHADRTDHYGSSLTDRTYVNHQEV